MAGIIRSLVEIAAVARDARLRPTLRDRLLSETYRTRGAAAVVVRRLIRSAVIFRKVLTAERVRCRDFTRLQRDLLKIGSTARVSRIDHRDIIVPEIEACEITTAVIDGRNAGSRPDPVAQSRRIRRGSRRLRRDTHRSVFSADRSRIHRDHRSDHDATRRTRRIRTRPGTSSRRGPTARNRCRYGFR